MSRAGAGPLHEDARLRRSLGHWQWAGLVVFLVLVASFPLYKAVESGRRADALAARQAALVTTGHRLWSPDCSSCHGDNGEGVDAPALNSKQFLESVSDGQMHHIVQSGVPGTEMPAWWDEFGGQLTDDEIAALVAYVRSWEKSAPSRPNWRNPGGHM
ncbi:MAG TPA: cytochrome c [Actinomycetota bacterium]